MTVKNLLEEIKRWVDNGSLNEDSVVYVTDYELPYDDSKIYTAGLCGGNEPCHDKSNPTKQALFITSHERVPNDSIVGEPFKLISGLLIENEMSKEKLNLKILEHDMEEMREKVKRYDEWKAEIEERKRQNPNFEIPTIRN